MINNDPTSPGFNSYASVKDAKDFASSRGYSLPDVDEEIEPLLMQAMDYLGNQSWRGRAAAADQPLDWPRKGISINGEPLSENIIPKKVIQAQCHLAVEAVETDLQPSFAGGGNVTSERVEGAVAVEYEAGTGTSVAYFSWFSGLLRGLVSSSGLGQFNVRRG